MARIKTWVSEKLTPADLNAEFDAVYDGFDPDGIASGTTSEAEFLATTDPNPSGYSIPTDLEGRLQRICYLIKQITGESEWPDDPDTDLASVIGGQMTLVTKTTTYVASITDGIILVSASGGAATITLPAVSTVATGKAYCIKKIDTSANVVTVDGDGTETLDGFVSRFLRDQNDYIWVYNDSANWVILGQSKPKRTPAYRNLVVRANITNPAYQIDVDADVLDVEDAAFNSYRLQSINLTLDLTASGTNGLDTGAEAGNTTYATWVIYNLTTNTVAGLLSTSFTLGGLTLPSGYTFGRLVGFTRNDGSSNIIPFQQFNEHLIYDDPFDDTQVLSSGSATTWTDVNATSFAGNSVITKKAILNWDADKVANSAGSVYFYIRPNGSGGNGIRLCRLETETGTDIAHTSGECMLMLDSSLLFEYKQNVSVASDLSIWVHGLILNL